MPRHRLKLLGPLRIETEAGQGVRLARRKAGVVLAYLALHPGPQPRERLALLLGGDAAAEDARRLLRVLLTELRKVLGEAAIVAERDTLALDPGQFLEPDTVLLAQRLAQGALDDALALWRGELLAGLDDDWVLPHRTRHHRLLIEALEARVAQERSGGAYEQAIAWARRLLAIEPAHERAHQHLMFGLLAQGDRQGALAQYQACRGALDQQLGVRPSAETEALRARAERLADAALAAQATNLPRPLTSFVGREDALEELADLLEGTRLLTLTGMGGHGKTRLAIQLADEVSRSYPDGVWWVELAPLAAAEQIERTLARVLGVKESLDQPLLDRLVARLDGQRVLVVLDNAEHLRPACAGLAEQLLGRCAGLTLLVTSREALGVAGERPWTVPPLPLPSGTQLKQLQANAAMRLLLERARGEGLQLTEDNAAALVALCRRLEGIPLAIELAAAQLRTLPLQAVVDALAHTAEPPASELPASARQALAPRQHTLSALVRWSYQLLDPAEQTLFRRLAVFAQSASVEAAAVVAGGYDDPDAPLVPAPLALPLTPRRLVEHVLDGLADKSLLRRWQTAHGVRYGMLETLRHFAREQLVAEGTLPTFRERHARHLADRLDREYRHHYAAEEAASMERLELELAELRALLAYQQADATTWLLTHHAIATLSRLCYVRGYYLEGRDWLTRLEQLPLGPAEDQRRAELANSLGLILWQSGDRAGARDAFLRALAMYEGLGLVASVAAVQNNLGCVAMDEDLHAAAEMHFERAVAISRTTDAAARTLAMALSNLGAILADRRAFEPARSLLEESLAIRRQLGDRRGEGVTLNGLGSLAAEQGQWAGARQHFTESLMLRARLQDRRGALYPLLNLIRVTLVEGAAAEAALLLGFVSATLAELQISLSREAQHGQLSFSDQARTQLGPQAFEAALAQGRALTLQSVVARLAARAPGLVTT